MNFDLRDKSDEATKSELPALEQLVKMGYHYLNQGDLNKIRRDLREVLLYDRIESAIRNLNLELDEDGDRDALHQIEEQYFPYTLDHLDTNEKIRAKLVGLSKSGGLEPVTVVQNFGDGPEDVTVRLFDFDKPENNDFLVTNQFELQGFKEAVYPDIVIFVNGIPLVVIECKSPYIADSISAAVDGNFEKYQSPGMGYDRLFFYNHILIATCGTIARHGTIGSRVNHYARWSEAYPLTNDEIKKKYGDAREQEILFAGMLDKARLLDLLKNFVTYEVISNRKVKKIAKHQQFRVVTKAVNRLNLKANIADKGGVIWHTQGSGKSLSML
ncbi:MAG: type I restriction endonuclease, partial [Nitrososphaerales archaeon]